MMQFFDFPSPNSVFAFSDIFSKRGSFSQLTNKLTKLTNASGGVHRAMWREWRYSGIETLLFSRSYAWARSKLTAPQTIEIEKSADSVPNLCLIDW